MTRVPSAKSSDLRLCARVALERCALLREGERVLVVTDPSRDQSVASALIDAAKESGHEATLVVIPARATTPQEPPAAAAAAMREAEVVFLYTTYSLSHSSARVEAQKAGARVISAPGVSEEGFLRTLSVNIDSLASLTNGLSDLVARSAKARIVTAAGTDLSLELGNPVTAIDGICERSGELDFFPPGMFLSVPRQGGVSGRAVVDGAITRIGKLQSPVVLSFEDGRLVGIEGGHEASKLKKLLASLEDDNAYLFAAWGIGTNPGAALLGEDPSFEGERLFGACHVSTGSNASFPGGTVRARIHLDGIITRPTVYLDGEPVLKNGVFMRDFS